MKKVWLKYCCIALFYLAVSFVFYPSIWKQVIIPEPKSTLLIQGETPIYEFVAETVRLNILSGRNPFAQTHNLLYPVSWNFAFDDVAPMNGFYFLFLRPFLSIHQAFMFIMAFGTVVSALSMLVLLRLLKRSMISAVVVGLVYGFSPFVSYRISGHPTYTAFYLFTLPAIFFVLLNHERNTLHKILWSFFLGISCAIVALSNLYFAVMFAIMAVLLAVLWFFLARAACVRYIKQNIIYISASIFTSLIVLTPWLLQVLESMRFNRNFPPESWVDNIAYSADIVGVVWPSSNPFYKSFFEILSRMTGYQPWFETFVYPGLIVLSLLTLFWFIRRKLPFFVTVFAACAVIFLLLILGPYPHFFGRMAKIALPFIFINSTMYLQMARAPARFIVPFLFLASFVVAYVLDFLFKKNPRIKKVPVFIALVIIFLIDQFVYIYPPSSLPLPEKIYTFLSKQDNSGPLLEVPFALRDGLKVHGYMHAVWNPRGQLVHTRPVFGVYAGRVNDYAFSYFQANPLLGPLGHLVNRDITDFAKIERTIDIQKLSQAVDFYGIRYMLLKNNERYSPFVRNIFKEIGFTAVMNDTGYRVTNPPGFETVPEKNGYTLWHRADKNIRTTNFAFNTDDDKLLLEQGWGEKEKGGRWAVGKLSTIYLNSPAKRNEPYLLFTAKTFADKQKVTVYINGGKQGAVTPTKQLKKYKVAIKKEILKRVNKITFLFSHVKTSSSVISGSLDTRLLSVFFSKIAIK